MTATFRPGLVVRYVPDPSRHDPRWCREGMAIADDRGRLVDTFWESMNEAHVLNDVEQATVEVLGHLDDYVRVSDLGWPNSHAEDYHPDDRLTVTHQHGLRRVEYVRAGSQRHLGTQIRDQIRKVRAAERAAAAATHDVESLRRGLDELLAQRRAGVSA